MIDSQKWVAEALTGCRREFGSRLLYLGLQGSYRRGEATESSDIDLVVVLDQVSLDDLDRYRSIVRSLPEGEKACGFIGGAADLAHWPRHELFQFKMDTADHYGSLDDFLPPLTRDDIQEGARVSAATLIHMLTHGYLYAAPEDRPAILKEAHKAAFFAVMSVGYLETGIYYPNKNELLVRLTGPTLEIVAAGLDFAAGRPQHDDKQAFDLLLTWAREVLSREF